MIRHNFSYLAAREIFLNPGDIGCGHKHEVFGTLLGSCVAITLWHPKRKIGSICHFVLPTIPDTREFDGRYGTAAFEHQKNDLLRLGVNVRQCVAKIFGGGKMFTHSGMQDVGLRNIAMARKLVADEGLVVTAENVGGEGYRRLYFDVETGEVWIKFDWLDSDEEDKIL